MHQMQGKEQLGHCASSWEQHSLVSSSGALSRSKLSELQILVIQNPKREVTESWNGLAWNGA